MMDRATGRSRGFGFVEMSTEEEAQKAIQQFNGHEFQGRNLNVNEARERTPGAPRGFGGGRGGYGGDFSAGPRFGGDDSGGSPGFGGGFNRGNFKPRKEGGSRRGLRAKKRSL
jgi:RNA recognition motif-containing protein